MEGRASKLRKVNRFRRALPHVSASALSAILDAVDRDGVPAAHARKDLREARNIVTTDDTPFGPILKYMDVIGTSGENKRIPIAHPFALLYVALLASVAFTSFFDS